MKENELFGFFCQQAFCFYVSLNPFIIFLSLDRMRDVHMLHHPQSVPMLDETSALHGNMPQHNDDEVGKHPRLAFSPAASVWGQMGCAWTTGGRGVSRTTEAITENDYVDFFHQFFGLTNNPALAPFANVPSMPLSAVFHGW